MKRLDQALFIFLLSVVSFNNVYGDCGNCATSCCSAKSTVSTEKCCELTSEKNCLIYGKTFFSARPQGSNTARGLVGTADKMHICNEKFNGVADLTLSYQETFNGEDIATWFSFNGSPSMTYGNSGSGAFDINGLNFGVTASGIVTFCPKIKNFTANLDLYFGLDEFMCGLWSRMQMPIVYTRWDLRLQDNVTGESSAYYEDNTVNFYPQEVVFKDLKTAWRGEKSLGASNTLPCGFGAIQRLTCGKICGTMTDTAVSDLHFDLGLDKRMSNNRHFGASLHVVAPTGTTPSSTYLFNAVAGANHSWQIGFGVNSGYELCSTESGKKVSLFFDSTITHIFASQQKRLLGLKTVGADRKTNAGSPFLVLKKFVTACGGLRQLDDLTPMIRAESILCCDVKVGSPIMADFSLMLQADACNWSMGVGWNFWFRTRERMKERCCTIPFQTYGIANLADGQTTFASASTFATASKSTISKTLGRISNTAPSNDGDDPACDFPVYISDDDVDICTALHPQAYSNKIFAFTSHTWARKEWQPFISFYGSVEIGHKNTAADTWEVGAKAGLQF